MFRTIAILRLNKPYSGKIRKVQHFFNRIYGKHIKYSDMEFRELEYKWWETNYPEDLFTRDPALESDYRFRSDETDEPII